MFANYKSSAKVTEKDIGVKDFIDRLERCDFYSSDLMLIKYMKSHIKEYESYWMHIITNPDRLPRYPYAVQVYIEQNHKEDEFEEFAAEFNTMMSVKSKEEIMDDMVYAAVVNVFDENQCGSVYLYRESDRRGIFVPREWLDVYLGSSSD